MPSAGASSRRVGKGRRGGAYNAVLSIGVGMRLLKRALTFDDILLLPAYSEVLPRDADLSTQFSRQIPLNIPLVSAAMDTVTESRLAIAIAQEGGIGVIHKNLSIQLQADEVRRVKRYESGVVSDPITVDPDMPIRMVMEISRRHRISGLPVVQGEQLIGIVTNRDLRFETRLDDPVRCIMTPQERLVTVREGASLEEAQSLMHTHRIERVLVVGEGNTLRGLVTVKDILKATEYPLAAKDRQGKLRVAAAIGTGPDSEERVAQLLKAGVDAVVVDTAHGHSSGVIEKVRAIKKNYPRLEVIAGNIATAGAARALVDAGADAVKVGIGPGSICTTRIVAGVGVPQISAIADVASALEGSGIPVIADGGIRFSGDAAKAIAAGASSVMMGSMFAGTEEAPGEVILYQGRSYKSYRGMGSLGAMKEGAADRYFQDLESNPEKLVPEGIEGRVPYKGSVLTIITQLCGGIQASMGYCGCKTMHDMRTRAEFVEITSAGMRESHVHDVQITKEAPNYHQDA